MIYVILGMHKSGTTLMSQMLHQSGIRMIDEEGYNNSYDSGQQFERIDFLLFNLAMLNIKKRYPIGKMVHTENEIRYFDNPKAFENLIKKTISFHESKDNDWGIKDPRTCLTYNIWKKILPDHKLICVFRSPYEVANRVAGKKSLLRYIYRFYKKLRALNAWCKHNENIVKIYQTNKDNALLIDYNHFMNGNSKDISELSNFCNREIIDLRNKNLYRNKLKNMNYFERLENCILNLLLGNNSRNIYRQLKKLTKQ